MRTLQQVTIARRYLPVLALLLAAIGSPALAANYSMLATDSRLEFTANQQGADFVGRFETFDAALRLNPDDASDNCLSASVDLASVNTEYQERDEYLVGEEWFNVAEYPTAEFLATGFKPDANGEFQTTAQLTLHGQTRELSMQFRFDGQRLTGSTIIDRGEFQVGQGMWASDDMVSVKVRVQVDVRFVPEE